MKALLTVTALVAMFSSSAFAAQGWQCSANDISVKVIDESAASGGIMVLSNPSVGSGRKTIAKFTEANGTLDVRGDLYVAHTDLRFNDSARAGELVIGTKLGEVASFRLTVRADEHSDWADGSLVAIKKNGERAARKVECERL